MFKRFGQVHLVFAMHSNWLVKVASAFAVAYGGITGLISGPTRLFLWLCGSPRPSTEVRFVRHSNWMVKLASAFAVAFGGITSLNWGLLGSFCGYAVLRTHRLK